MNVAELQVAQSNPYDLLMTQFTEAIDAVSGVGSVKVTTGRRFDRVIVDDKTRYFVDRNTHDIYGAKSNFQYNPRRTYGNLTTVPQFNWLAQVPIPGSDIHDIWYAAEASIVASYKPRGRPRKVVANVVGDSPTE